MIQQLTTDDLRAMISKPELHRLKQITEGLEVGRVLHKNVLIEAIIPETQLDKLEKSGLLYVPEESKKNYTPMSSFGVVLKMGPEVPRYDEATGNGLEPGMVVFFSKHAGVTATFDGMKETKDGGAKQTRTLKLLPYGEIFCTLNATSGDMGGVVAALEPIPDAPDIPVAAGVSILG